MQVFRATPDDSRAIAEIHVNTWRTAYESILPAEYLASLSIDRREAMWRKCIAETTSDLLVVRDNTSIFGWLNFGACRDVGATKTEAEVWALYVSPSFWSCGAGRMLWLRARELMLAQDFTSCSLRVFPKNERAINFYRAAGFVRTPSPPKHFELGGKQLQKVQFVSLLKG